MTPQAQFEQSLVRLWKCAADTQLAQSLKRLWKQLTASETKLKVGGVSLQGEYHDINQDAFACVSGPAGTVVVLSDGVGSCRLSHFGSRALCEAVVEEAFEALCDVGRELEFLRRVHARWLKKLRGLPVDECSCTALFVVVKKRRFAAFQLGDGAVVVKADDDCTALLENKDEDFRNYTDAMDETLRPELWRIVSRDFENFQGALLCSDGVGIDRDTPERWAEFATGFFEYQTLPVGEVEQTVAGWLKDWDGSDDKTVAFALRDEEARDEPHNEKRPERA